MKIRKLLILSTLLSIQIHAQQERFVGFGKSDEEIKNESDSRENLKKQFRGYQIDFNPTYYRYTEPNLMHLKGLNYRIGGEYTFFLSTNSTWLMHIDYSFAYSKLDYSSYGTGSMKNKKNIINELRIYVGRAVNFAGYPLKYYFGPAYRQLNNDARGKSSTGHNGYRRRSQYFTIGAGSEWLIPLSNTWDFRLKNEFSFLPLGIQTSYLGDVEPADDKIVNVQAFGVNLRLNPNFVYSKHFIFGPYIDLWYVADSDKVYVGNGKYLYEPENNTVELGLLVGARF